MDKKYLTVKDAMKIYSCSRGTIYNLISEGKLTPLKVGRKTYFTCDQVDSLFQVRI